MATERTVVSHPPEAVLDIKDVAKWLRVSTRAVERLDIPCFYLGNRTRRYLGESVLDYLRKKSA